MKRIKIKEKIAYAKAFVCFNSWEWDELLGEKPVGFDDLKDYSKNPDEKTKYSYSIPKMHEIRIRLGRHYKIWESWAWWKYELHKPFIKWIFWYFTTKHM